MTDDNEWPLGKRVLLFDIETFPNIGMTWEKYEQDVIHFVKEWELASVSYKWLSQPGIFTLSRLDFMEDKTDESLTKAVWRLFDEAEVLIAHNGDQFDVKKVKAKFVEYKLDPPSPYNTVDTKKIAKGQFKFNSNSLNDLAKLLKIGKKVETGGFDLWLRCMNWDDAAWSKMIEYNRQDVALLEEVYLRLRPWAKNHPSIGMLNGEKFFCKVCGSGDYRKHGRRLYAGGWKTRVQCHSCGRWDAIAEQSLVKDEQIRALAEKIDG